MFTCFSLEILPLVEFELEEGITDKEAVRLIETPKSLSINQENDKWMQDINEDQQTLQINSEMTNEADIFTQHLLNFEVLDMFFNISL